MLKLHFYNHKTLRHLKKQSFYHCCKCCLCKAYSPDTFQTHLVNKKKKGLHFDFIAAFPILFPKPRCSLKKKGLYLESISLFPNFCPDFSKFRAIIKVQTFFFREHLDFGNKIEKSEMKSK